MEGHCVLFPSCETSNKTNNRRDFETNLIFLWTIIGTTDPDSKNRTLKHLLFIITVITLPFFSKAQYTFTGGSSGLISVSSVQSITLTGGSAIPSFTSANDYATGVTASNYMSVALKSNVAWTLSIQAQNTYFTRQSSSGSLTMPASVLSVKPSTSGTYFALSTSAQTLKTGSKGTTTTSGNSFNVDIKYNPGWAYSGGIYTMGLVWTLSQQ